MALNLVISVVVVSGSAQNLKSGGGSGARSRV
jgi:hypothetical protein